MANFRKNHPQYKTRGVSLSVRIFLMIGITTLALVLVWNRLSKVDFGGGEGQPVIEAPSVEFRNYLPEGGAGEVYHKKYYSLAYREDAEQAEWVAYRLSRRMLEGKRFPRTDWFEEDRTIASGSASYEDYRGSGYSKGHLVPAADMAFSPDAMVETFLMSNISPQSPAFNGGIWRELEELVRDWARDNTSLYIVTGPVLEGGHSEVIGIAEVTVPRYYFKAILDAETPGKKGIAFLVPNAVSEAPVMDYAVTIDSVEQVTGLDFFPALDLEDLESEIDTGAWPVDDNKFQRRITDWNRRNR